MGPQRVRDGFAAHAMALQLFCEYVCRINFLDLFKMFTNSLRYVHDSCEDFANPRERFTTVKRLVRELNYKTVPNPSHPIGIIDLHDMTSDIYRGRKALNQTKSSKYIQRMRSILENAKK